MYSCIHLLFVCLFVLQLCVLRRQSLLWRQPTSSLRMFQEVIIDKYFKLLTYFISTTTFVNYKLAKIQVIPADM